MFVLVSNWYMLAFFAAFVAKRMEWENWCTSVSSGLRSIWEAHERAGTSALSDICDLDCDCECWRKRAIPEIFTNQHGSFGFIWDVSPLIRGLWLISRFVPGTSHGCKKSEWKNAANSVVYGFLRIRSPPWCIGSFGTSWIVQKNWMSLRPSNRGRTQQWHTSKI